MTSYAGRHAELYDLFYADKPYAEEAAFVDHCLNNFAGSPMQEILELACGTGRHAFELEKYGYRITATDYSPDMLQIAQPRAADCGSKILFIPADMRSLEMPAKKYDAFVCLFDSIGYVKTDDAIANVLEGVRRCLRPGGLFIFEFWNAAAMQSQYSPVRIRRWKTPDGEVIRISETELDRENKLANVDYTIHELKKDGTYSTVREMQTNRYFTSEEMQMRLSTANFEPLKFFAGFKDDEAIGEDTWHVVAVARA